MKKSLIISALVFAIQSIFAPSSYAAAIQCHGEVTNHPGGIIGGDAGPSTEPSVSYSIDFQLSSIETQNPQIAGTLTRITTPPNAGSGALPRREAFSFRRSNGDASGTRVQFQRSALETQVTFFDRNNSWMIVFRRNAIARLTPGSNMFLYIEPSILSGQNVSGISHVICRKL